MSHRFMSEINRQCKCAVAILHRLTYRLKDLIGEPGKMVVNLCLNDAIDKRNVLLAHGYLFQYQQALLNGSLGILYKLNVRLWYWLVQYNIGLLSAVVHVYTIE